MHILFWFLSFVFLAIGTIAGIAASIGAIGIEWLCFAAFSAMMVGCCATWADAYNADV